MATTQSKDPNEQVHHPRHYNQHPSGIETIELIENLPSNLSNAMKYVWRCGLKAANDPLRELRSAEWYVRREIGRRTRVAPTVPDESSGLPSEYSIWSDLAERIIADAKERETHDLLAFCLGDLLRDDLEGLAGRIRQAALGVW